MTFARHLQDTQTPEWKNAYIDYRGLKVHLGRIRAQALHQVDTSSSFGNTESDHTHLPTPDNEEEFDESEEDLIRGNPHIASLWVSGADPTTGAIGPSGHGLASSMRWRTSNHGRIPSFSLALASLPRVAGPMLNAPLQEMPPSRSARRRPDLNPFKNPGPLAPSPLQTILSHLPVIHVNFFDMLDAELEKVATFYAEREKEMHERSKLLRKQLNELGVHRQIFYESAAHSQTQNWVKRAFISVPLVSSLVRRFSGRNAQSENPRRVVGNGSELWRAGHRGFIDTSNLGSHALELKVLGDNHSRPGRNDGLDGAAEKGWVLGRSARLAPIRLEGFPGLSLGGPQYHLDPLAYKQAKRRLRKAVAEHYRGLDILNNYRLLNLTGFRKALRKYEKITKTSILDAYMKEKVEPSAFASGAIAGNMLKEMEHLYAMRFERGDRKKAKNHLRVEPQLKTHGFNIFRSGLWFGLAIPAIVAGCYLSFQEYTRRTLQPWSTLLFVYSVFLIPVLMALLISVNLLVWVRNGISYVFIFKLDPRERTNHQEYFELPSFLLCTLAYGYWFSMSRLGPPMAWPLIWLAITGVLMFNPFRSFMWGSTRWWTIKKIAKLGASGLWNVEFVDLWLGDQFCSLIYPISNLYFVGCVYARSQQLSSAQAQEVWATCGIAPNWRSYYLLGMLPFLARLVQSLRRYRDSKLPGQLINAGKYGMGMMQLFFYCYWRHQKNPRTGQPFVLWCFSSVVNSLYSSAWDILVDWSMCQPHAQYPLLRRGLGYESHILWYYFAMISNVCIRFIWLIFIIFDGVDMELRTFIAAMLEMLRRIVWNFYRVENKHVSNMEEHRVTREVSLPYSFDAHPSEEEAYIARLQLRKRLARLS